MKFEYKVLAHPEGVGGFDSETLERELNALASEGWKLVSAAAISETPEAWGGLVAVMEREAVQLEP